MNASSAVVDVHGHLYHPRWYPSRVNDYLVADFLRRQPPRNSTRSASDMAKTVLRMLTDSSGETTVKIMDKVGIKQRVILIIDWGVELGEPEASIESIHEEVLTACRNSGGRLIGFAGLDPRRPSAPELLRWAKREFGAAGLKLHPTGSWTLREDATRKLVAVAVDHDMPILVHVGRTMQILSEKHSQPVALMDLARQFPSGKFIAGHSGFEQYVEFTEAEDVAGNIFFDIAGWQEMAGDEHSAIQQHITALLRAFPGRVCFGTDSPFYTYNLISQETRWTGLVHDCVQQVPEDLKPAATQLLACPEPLRMAMGVC